MEERDNIRYLLVGNRLSKSIVADYLLNNRNRGFIESVFLTHSCLVLPIRLRINQYAHRAIQYSGYL